MGMLHHLSRAAFAFKMYSWHDALAGKNTTNRVILAVFALLIETHAMPAHIRITIAIILVIYVIKSHSSPSLWVCRNVPNQNTIGSAFTVIRPNRSAWRKFGMCFRMDAVIRSCNQLRQSSMDSTPLSMLHGTQAGNRLSSRWLSGRWQ